MVRHHWREALTISRERINRFITMPISCGRWDIYHRHQSAAPADTRVRVERERAATAGSRIEKGH